MLITISIIASVVTMGVFYYHQKIPKAAYHRFTCNLDGFVKGYTKLISKGTPERIVRMCDSTPHVKFTQWVRLLVEAHIDGKDSDELASIVKQSEGPSDATVAKLKKTRVSFVLLNLVTYPGLVTILWIDKFQTPWVFGPIIVATLVNIYLTIKRRMYRNGIRDHFSEVPDRLHELRAMLEDR